MNQLESTDVPIEQKLTHALSRIELVLRADQWQATHGAGLNPTQGQILMLLARKKTPMRLQEIAHELSVSGPTVSDSVAALSAKELVKKQKSKEDARALAITLTRGGSKLVRALDDTSSVIEAAIERLPEPERVAYFRTTLKLIRELQQIARIPIARMCVTCRYFRPNVHRRGNRPHHCALVDAAFGDRSIRTECSDHEVADPHLAAQNWNTFSES